MSAWIVSKTHIDALVQAGIEAELVRPEEADEFGRMLWAENLASICYRYPNDGDGERPGPIDFRDADVDKYVYEPLDGEPGVSRAAPGVVHWTASCYDCQTCEHPEYETSKAKQFVDILVKLTDGHSDGPWGTDERDAFINKKDN